MPPKKSTPEDVLRAFGKRLAQEMGRQRVSQAAVGEFVGRGQTAVSDWVLGNTEPEPSIVFALEECLDLTPGELSRLLGYIPAAAASPVEEALLADPALDERYRQSLLANYRAYLAVLRSRGQEVEDPGGSGDLRRASPFSK
jgi:transcriptional regulator with XRE-family HTH domain